MDISIAATVLTRAWHFIKGLFTVKKSESNLPAQTTRDVDASGTGNPIIQAGRDATVAVHVTPSQGDDFSQLPKGAACPHLKPEMVSPGKYRAVGFWKPAQGWVFVPVEGDGIISTYECRLGCGHRVSGLIPKEIDLQDQKSINAYCINDDPSQPSKELIDFWRSRGLLH